jgi:hypothetical protein
MRHSFVAFAAGIAVSLISIGGPAAAKPQLYQVDRSQSRLELATASSLHAELAGLGAFSLPFATQLGAIGGVSGATLPGIGSSNGLVTSLDGQLLVDRKEGTLRVQRSGTSITLGVSGSWAPGPSTTPPGAAQIGVRFADAGSGIAGTAAARNVVFSFETAKRTLVPAAGGFEFAGFEAVSVEDGAFDYEAAALGAAGRGSLDSSTPIVVTPATARLERLAGGLERLVLPFDLSVPIPEAAIGTGLGLSATLALHGQIVAVPEPSGAWIAIAAIAALASRMRRRSGRS